MMRRLAAACLMLGSMLMMSGCSPMSRATLASFRQMIHPSRPALSITAASVAAKPYYQLEVNSPTGSSLLILGNIDHGREAWYDASGGIVFLHYGLLVKTNNLRPDILATRLPADSPFRLGLQHLTAPVTTTRSLDLPDYRYGVKVTSRLTPEGMRDITILGTVHHLLLIDEQARAPSIGFTANNRYWVDPHDGFVWKSRQTIPGGLTLTMTELRPYRGKGS